MVRLRHPLLAVAAVIVLVLPWVGFWLGDATGSLSTVGVIVTNGVAVLGAVFVLTWAVETAEKDVPRVFALAVIAVPSPSLPSTWRCAVRVGGRRRSGGTRLGERRRSGRRKRTIAEGFPHEVITECSAEHGIDPVVLGASGRSGVREHLLGSTVKRVARSGDTPVLIARS